MVVRRATHELNFIKGKDPLPTVEVNVESVEAQGLSFPKIVCEALDHFAKKNPKVRATVRLHGTMSVNFRQLGWSEFLAVAGPNTVLNALSDAFACIPGVKSRYSDYLDPKQGRRTFHIEDGLLWEIEDAMSWFSSSTAKDEESQTPDLLADGLEDDSVACALLDESEHGNSAEEAPEVARRQAQAARFRAARSDASIESIRQKIEQSFGLPEGSVALCGPDGRPLRKDARIKTLRRRWEDA